MKKFIVLIALIVAKSELISSENPSCWMFDFNDPSTMNEFKDGIYVNSAPVLKSYNETTIAPFRPDSRYYLGERFKGPYGSISSKNKFRINLVTVVMEMAVYQEVNKEFGYADVTVTDLNNRYNTTYLSLSANGTTNGWVRFQNNYKQHIPAFMDNSEISIRVIVRDSNFLAIEYLRFYHPELTDENCVPRQSVTDLPTTVQTIDYADTTSATTSADTTSATTSVDTTSATTSADTTTATTSADTTTATTDQSTVAIENPSCSKFEFNRPSNDLSDFQTCDRLYLPTFVIKSYEDLTVLPPRYYASHYLSNKWEGMTCMETSRFLSLNESSSIQMAIYFEFAVPGAWVKVYVLDRSTGTVETVLEITSSSSTWRILDGKIDKKFANGKIMIQTNMNSYTGLAIDYIDILNAESLDEECRRKSEFFTSIPIPDVWPMDS